MTLDAAELGRWNLGILRARYAYEGLRECADCKAWARRTRCPTCENKRDRWRKDQKNARARAKRAKAREG